MKKKLSLFLIVLITAVIHGGLYQSRWGEELERGALDLWFHLRGPVAAPDDVILIAMDEDSYQELEIPMDQAWPRSRHSQLLKRLAQAGAKKAVFDVLFLGPSNNADDDRELAEALAGLPTAIGADYGVSLGAVATHQLLLPYEPFRSSVQDIALVGFPEDAGVVRRFKTTRTELTQGYPSLAEAGATDRSLKERPGKRDMISYYGAAGSIPTYSYYEVLDPELVPEEEIKGKIAYIGLIMRTALGPAQKDSFLTPFWRNGRTFGVEIHATAAANLRTQTWISRFDSSTETLVLTLTALVGASLIFLFSPLYSFLSLLFILVGWSMFSFSLFLKGFFLPGVTLITIVLPTAFLCSTLIYYFRTYRKQKQTQKAFEHYLSPEMAREASKNPSLLHLGGTKMEATALFTDIANFTSITEPMSAEEVSSMLNSYFTEVMEVVFDNDGTLIKFIGDSIFAIWGAPKKIPNHAEQALKAAMLIAQEVERFNAKNQFPPLHTRIGLHQGEMLIGNLGSARRFDFTAVGDSVNLASRLEGLNKYFGTTILFSSSVEEALEENFNYVQIASVKVVGKNEATPIYTLLPETLADIWTQTWNWARESFQEKDFDNAQELFTQISEADTPLSDGARFYLEQIANKRLSPPSEDWQGEISFLTK